MTLTGEVNVGTIITSVLALAAAFIGRGTYRRLSKDAIPKLDEVNHAVNHQPEGEATLVEKVNDLHAALAERRTGPDRRQAPQALGGAGERRSGLDRRQAASPAQPIGSPSTVPPNKEQPPNA